jgi:ABC-type cobalt transport system substrate-binding protein
MLYRKRTIIICIFFVVVVIICAMLFIFNSYRTNNNFKGEDDFGEIYVLNSSDSINQWY